MMTLVKLLNDRQAIQCYFCGRPYLVVELADGLFDLLCLQQQGGISL